jgi:hypothetical protein
MTGTKTEWKEQTSKIGWTNVPASVNKLLAIFKGRYVNYMTDPDERKKTAMRQLSEQMTEEEIRSGMAWLEEHRKQYAFSSKNARGYNRDVQYVRLNVPYTRYQRYGGNYRGITSTVAWNQFNIEKGMEKWQAIVDAHWSERTFFKDAKAFAEQSQHLGKIKRRVENAENNYIVDDPDRWDYRELDEEYKAGDLMPEPDYQEMTQEILDNTYITEVTLVEQLPALAERLVAATKIQYQASKDWHEVMNDIYNKMKEMIE